MKDGKWILPVVAAFLVLSSVAHGILGWKAMRSELVLTGASSDLVADLATGWYLGSVAMVVFAAIIFFSWREARGKNPLGRVAGPLSQWPILLSACLRFCSGHSTCIFLLPL
jgi:hypothetical protein